MQEYEAIGTVEECREAVEKQKPKKPKDEVQVQPEIDEMVPMWMLMLG